MNEGHSFDPALIFIQKLVLGKFGSRFPQSLLEESGTSRFPLIYVLGKSSRPDNLRSHCLPTAGKLRKLWPYLNNVPRSTLERGTFYNTPNLSHPAAFAGFASQVRRSLDLRPFGRILLGLPDGTPMQNSGSIRKQLLRLLRPVMLLCDL